MNTIRPKTYHEIMTFKRCTALKKHIPHLENDMLLRIYHYLIAAKGNMVIVTKERLTFYDIGGNIVDTVSMAALATAVFSFSQIGLSADIWNVVYPAKTSSGYTTSGSSGNNNNNNNNNNNG